jgi:hypothetical protein
MTSFNVDTNEWIVGDYDSLVKISGTGTLTKLQVAYVFTVYMGTYFPGRRLGQINVGGDFTSIEKMDNMDLDFLVFSPRSMVTTLPNGCFEGGNMVRVLLPSQVLQEIPLGCFANCSRLVSMDIPDSVTVVGATSFSGCVQLKEVVIPSTVTSINESAFNGCSTLQKVTFSPTSSLTYVGPSAFSSTALTHLDLPPSLVDIGAFLVQNVPTLQSLAMNRVIWEDVVPLLEPGVLRYIYFPLENIVYTNRTNNKDDLEVDDSETGRSFFTKTIQLFPDEEEEEKEEEIEKEKEEEKEKLSPFLPLVVLGLGILVFLAVFLIVQNGNNSKKLDSLVRKDVS